jgi:signal transduction histidine kinase
MMSGRAVAIAALASGVVTAAVVVRSASRVLYGPELASSLETAAFAVTLLAVSLAFGRLRRERARSHLALLSERQRIACDLHDGLAQELAYLTRNLDALVGSVEPEILDRLRSATERAQLESRLTISRLAIPGPRQEATAVADAVRDAVGQIARRFAVDLDLDLQPGVRLAPSRSEALVRIACEAVANAARHSGARQVSLSLHRHGSRVWLRVSDNGSGFDPGLATTGFGLVSMRERASSVGGDLRVSSVPGQGTEVVAAL